MFFQFSFLSVPGQISFIRAYRHHGKSKEKKKVEIGDKWLE